jgi:hypothetical protein
MSRYSSSPGHLERGIALGTVIDGLQRALDEANPASESAAI